MIVNIIFIGIWLGLEAFVFFIWEWRGFFFLNGLLIFLEYLLRDNLDSFFQEANVNVKKIPTLVLDRRYEFLDPQKKINWDHDDCLGWRLKPNYELGINISIPELGLNHTLTYCTDEKGRRRTSRGPADHLKRKRVFSILGCSFTYGHSLNDQDTYAWLLQEKFPDKKVLNYAVAGYSLYQCLLVLEKNIEQDKPEVVVVGFHSDLGWRNTCTFKWAQLIQSTWKIPSCVFQGGRLRRHAPQGYVYLPFSNLRIMKLLELNLNRLIFMGRGRKNVIENTMKHLLLQIKALCDQQGAKLIVACIDDAKEYYDFLAKNKLNWCVTGIDTKKVKDDGTFKWILYPFDNHPNREANQRYAEVIGKTIENLLIGRSVSADPELLRDGCPQRDRGAYIYPHF